MSEDIFSLVIVALVTLLGAIATLCLGILIHADTGSRITLFCVSGLCLVFSTLATIAVVRKCRNRYERV